MNRSNPVAVNEILFFKTCLRVFESNTADLLETNLDHRTHTCVVRGMSRLGLSCERSESWISVAIQNAEQSHSLRVVEETSANICLQHAVTCVKV